MGRYVNYSPYGDAAQFGNGLGNTFAQLAIQLPEIKARQAQAAREQEILRLRQNEDQRAEKLFPTQQADMEAQVKQRQALTGQEAAHGKVYEAQAEQLKMDMDAKTATAEAIKRGDLQGAAAAMQMWHGENPLQAGEAAIRMMSYVASNLGKQDGSQVNGPNAAAATGMAAFVTPHNLPSGSTAIDPVTHQQVAAAPFTLPANAARFQATGGQPVATNLKVAAGGNDALGVSKMSSLLVTKLNEGDISPEEYINASKTARSGDISAMAQLVSRVAGGPTNAPAGTAPAVAPAPVKPAPQPGTVYKEHVFKGGNPADPGSWHPVNATAAKPRPAAKTKLSNPGMSDFPKEETAAPASAPAAIDPMMAKAKAFAIENKAGSPEDIEDLFKRASAGDENSKNLVNQLIRIMQLPPDVKEEQ